MNFNELPLSENTLLALAELGFTEPTPIQEQAIPQLLEQDTDLMGLAQTGTGKTAAFALPIIEKLEKNKFPQALILCPTRELCIQITNDIQKFTKYHDHINTVAIYGGASIVTQIRELRRGVQIIVATPGRMQDVINRGEVNFEKIKICVLDEADEMLNMGFKESISEILSNTPSEKNTWLFTATMPKEIKSISKKFMDSPVEVAVSVNKGNENIEHEYYIVNPHNRYPALKRLVDYNPDIFAIVFCRTKNDCKDIADNLIRDGYNSDALHGDLTQQQRDVVMNRYREKSLQILVATDVAARGIDVSDVTHVINYSLPDDIENYTHRSGRTARAGKKGISISIITKRDAGKIFEIEKIIGKKFLKSQIPNGFDVCEKQLFSIIYKAKEVEINHDLISPYIEKINLEFENMDKETIIKKFASIEFNRFLDYYQNAPDLNLREDGKRKEGNTTREFSNNAQVGFTRFFINIGSLDDLRRGDLLRTICDKSNINGTAIGRIDMKGMFSFFEVESKFQDDILSSMKSFDFMGKKVRVDLASNNSDQGNQSSFRSSSRPRRDSGFSRDRDRDSSRPRRDSGFSRDRDRDSSRPRRDSGNFNDNNKDSNSNSNNRNSDSSKPKRRTNKFPYSFD